MIKVVSAGIYTTIQDLGRFGFGDIGVPNSGVMDAYSAKLANNILGNKEHEAVLEITLGKTVLLFENKLFICITGANFTPKLNKKPIALNSVILVNSGDILTFTKPIYGMRSYLAIKGGFQTNIVLNSRSFYKRITDNSTVKKNDLLPTNSISSEIKKPFAHIKINKQHFTTNNIEVYKGPEYNQLNERQKEKLSKTRFTISNHNDRMGYRLVELVPNKLGTMLTSAVLPGTVQLTPSGKLIVLMRDCQVTGGYPRILQLTDDAINILAQKTTNDVFNFKLVDLNV